MKVIAFGAHTLDKDHPAVRTATCDLCGEKMNLAKGAYTTNMRESILPPEPEKIHLIFAKECFVDLVKAFVEGLEGSISFQKHS